MNVNFLAGTSNIWEYLGNCRGGVSPPVGFREFYAYPRDGSPVPYRGIQYTYLMVAKRKKICYNISN